MIVPLLFLLAAPKSTAGLDGSLKRFTEVDYKDRVAFVITIHGEIMGIGRYDRLADPTEAEVAFNIADAHQGKDHGDRNTNENGA